MERDKRFINSKIGLLGGSEGTIISSLFADRKVAKMDGLLLYYCQIIRQVNNSGHVSHYTIKRPAQALWKSCQPGSFPARASA
jgi:hypothetical protein